MKRVMNYFTCMFILFFGIFISNVKAEDINYNISPNQSIPLILDRFIGVSCSEENFVFLEASEITYKYVDVIENGSWVDVQQTEARMIVNYASSDFPEEDARVETLHCTFIRDAETGVENGEFDVNFTIRPFPTDVDNLIIVYGYHPAWDIFLPIYENDYMIENLKSVTKITPGADAGTANSYIDINCPEGTTTSCTFSANNRYNPDDGAAIAYYDIEYRDNFDVAHSASFTITIQPNKYVYADFATFSTCSFGSSWSTTEYSNRMRADLKVDNRVTLPSCRLNSGVSPLFKFHGWIDLSAKDASGTPYGDQVDSKKMDTCASYPTVTNPVMTQESDFYYACYTSLNGVALHPDGGTLSNRSGTEMDGVVYFDVTGNFTLPTVTSIPEKYNLYSDAQFYGWKDADGNICNPNETTCVVPANGGHYFAVYSNNGISVNDAQSAVVYVEEHIAITMPGGITDCTENSDAIDRQVSGGECYIFGQAPTNDSYVDVTVVSGGQTYIYKIKVLEREGNFNNWMNDVIIDLSNNADYGITNGTGQTVTTSNGTTLCETYLVANSGIRVTNVATYQGFGLSFNQYRATSTCDSSMVHLALCMDPGRPGPETNGATIYVVDTSFDPENEFGRVLTHIVKEFVREDISKEDTSTNAKNTIAAANAAVRLAQYFSTEELANTSDNKTTPYYRNAIASYTAAGRALKNKCSTGLEGCSADSIRTALTSAWVWSNTDVLNKVVSYLSSYENTEAVAKINDVVNNYTQEPVEYTSAITFTYNGVFNNFGSDVNFNELQIEKDCEDLCSGSSCCNLNYSIVGDEIHYTFVVSLTESNAKKISTFSRDKLPAITIASSASGYQAANVFVLKPRNGNHQRMATFNLEGAKMRFPFEFNTTCDLNYGPLNPSNSNFDPTLFREMGCCDTIRGNPAYEETQKYYCSQLCYSSNFQLYCNPNEVGATNGIDSYSIKEGKVGASGASSFYCLVDVTADTNTGKVETRKKVDYAGNKFVNSATGVADNKYCAVSCREEWDISLPGFDNFLGTKAINAGGFFSIDKYIFFNSKRSCYSTFIDYEAYVTEQQTLSNLSVDAYTVHSEYTQVYSILEDSKSTMNLTYKKWYYNSSEDYNCHSNDGCREREYYDCYCNEETGSCSTCSRCVDWYPCTHTCHVWRSNTYTCTVYTIDTDDSRSFNAHEYDGGQPKLGEGFNISQAVNVPQTLSTDQDSLGSSSARTKVQGRRTLYSYHKEGSKPPASTHSTNSSYEGSCCGSSGYYNCSYGTVGYEQLLTDANYKGSNVKQTIDNKANALKSYTNQMRSNAQSISQCQNFVLKNESTKNTWNSAVNPSISPYQGKKLFENTTIITDGSPKTEIRSNFEPEASYEYEEHFFMAELAKEGNANVIVPFVSENDNKCRSGGTNCGVDIGRTNAYSEDLKLYRGYSEEQAYNPDGREYEWTPDIEGVDYNNNADKIGISEAFVQYMIPLCITTDAGVYRYQGVSDNKKCETALGSIYQFNYLTRTLQNSSYYVNKGHWFVDSVNDVKGHGDSATAAVANNGAGMKPLTTDLFGATYNTFPIGLNTPRNIYQYSYAFRGLGIYNEYNSTCYYGEGNCTTTSNPPGRILGNPELSMIKDNVRKCFYEVFEDLCKCCGDPIVWYSHSTSRINETKDYFDDIGEDFEPSNDNYYNRTSNFGPKPSTVSLFDVDGSNNRTLGDNWSSNDQYYYIGKPYYTDKGSELLQHITSKGDTIYNNTDNLIPEYSYTLTPSILAQIRNDNVPYGYSSNSITVVSKVCYGSGPCDVDTTDHGFYHFGSKFLEGYLSSAQTPGFGSIITGTTGSGCIVTDASSGFNRNCRWVDYKTSSGHYLALK